MFNKILIVCVGNICRSPTGERLLRQLNSELLVNSAGLSALVGKEADKMAIQVANDYGVNLENHKAQQLTREICNQYDLILVMEKKHIEGVTKISSESRGKTMLFGQWIGEKDIPDPYRQSREAFEYTYQLISDAAEAWSKKLA